jgi:hypothetical protein
MFSNFFPENRAVCEIMWKNMVEPEEVTDANITRHMRFACWITKTTHTHSHWEYVILIALPQQYWFPQRASVLRSFTYIYLHLLTFACPVKNIRIYCLQRGLLLFFVILTLGVAELALMFRSPQKCNPSPGVQSSGSSARLYLLQVFLIYRHLQLL